MAFNMKPILFSLLLSAGAVVAKEIYRDVCIIGGGSSGTYSAIRLQQKGYSVALFEKENRLGGHVNTYKDPSTGEVVDYGVAVFTNETVVHDYFNHFNLSLVTRNLGSAAGSGATVYTNFLDGKALNSSTVLSGDLVGAFTRYVQLLSQYSYINGEWDLPSPVPEDLLLSWGDFVAKHNLTAVNTIVYGYNQGQGNFLAQRAFYVLRQFSLPQVTGVANGFLINPAGNQVLYNRALAELGSNAFLSSVVTDVTRDEEKGVICCAETPEGPVTVYAKKLIVAIDPTATNLRFLNLDFNEQSLFSQFNGSYYWNSLLRNTGLPANSSYLNLDPNAPLFMPAQPAAYVAVPSADGDLVSLYYGSAHYMSDETVRQNIAATVARLRAGAGIPDPEKPLKFEGFHNHSPYTLTVSNQAIRDGFYAKLKALQGKKNTYFTGAVWANDASGEIWNFTETTILPRVMAE